MHEVVEPDALMTRAIDLGRELAEGPQVAMRLLKRSIYNAAELTFAQALDEIAAKTAVSDHHPDATEGMRRSRRSAPRASTSRCARNRDFRNEARALGLLRAGG